MENKLIPTGDGSHTLLSATFQAHYHSLHGAVQESLHVFIAMGLEPMVHLPNLEVLEIGFGTGLNAWLTWQHQPRPCVVYHSYETHPITLVEAEKLNYAKAGSQNAFMFLHTSAWNEAVPLDEGFTLFKHRAEAQTANLQNPVHLVYLDAFAPGVQPELWSETFFCRLYALMAPAGLLVTYCAKGDVKRALRAAGFTVERLPGPPGKRHMLRARKDVHAG